MCSVFETITCYSNALTNVAKCDSNYNSNQRVEHEFQMRAIRRAHLNQTGGLQRLYNVSCDGLADNGLGAGSGWQQSKQN
jgi:hypothetical protein